MDSLRSKIYWIIFGMLLSCTNNEAPVLQTEELVASTKAPCPLDERRASLETLYQCKVLMVQVTAENEVYFEGEPAESGSIGEKIQNAIKGFTDQEQQTYQVDLIAHEETGMRIISEIKEQLREIGAMRIIFQLEDNLLESDC